MNVEKSNLVPTEINLHQVSRVLELTFEDGSNYKLPAEYLRVYSPSAEVQGHGPGQDVLQIGKEDVGIDSIDQQHKKLISLINSLQTAVDYKAGAEFEREALDALVDYTKTHFSYEEGLMEQNGLDQLVTDRVHGVERSHRILEDHRDLSTPHLLHLRLG